MKMLHRVCCVAVCVILCAQGALATTLADVYNESWERDHTGFKQKFLGERDQFLSAAQSYSRRSKTTFAVGMGFALGSAGACFKKPFLGYVLIAPAIVSLCCFIASLIYTIKSSTATKKQDECHGRALHYARMLAVCKVNKETCQLKGPEDSDSWALSFVRSNLEEGNRALTDKEHNRLVSIQILQKTLEQNGKHTDEVDALLLRIKVDSATLALPQPSLIKV